MFVGRVEELGALEKAYTEDTFQFVVVYGRRRVGKTVLINEFCKGRRAIQFTAYLTGEKSTLVRFSSYVAECLHPGTPLEFSSLEALLRYICAQAQQERLILSIDEFPYLVDSIPETMSILQNLVDHEFKTSKLMLILSGSSMGFMEHQVLGMKSPLYGRRTRQIHVMPFTLRETSLLLAGRTRADIVTVQAVTGGIPQYISYFQTTGSLQSQLKELFFTKDGLLFNEPSILLQMESRDVKTYTQICEILASGTNQAARIADKMGALSSTVNAALNSLAEMGIVEKIQPVGSPVRRPLWIFSDYLFGFWFRFVFPYASFIISGYPRVPYENMLEKLPGFIGHAFEQMSHQYILATSHLPIIEIGRWWGPDKNTRTEEEIDIVARTSADIWLFGECKWTGKKIGVAEYQLLMYRSHLVVTEDKREFWLFCKSGFTDELQTLAQSDETLHLVSLEQLFSGK